MSPTSTAGVSPVCAIEVHTPHRRRLTPSALSDSLKAAKAAKARAAIRRASDTSAFLEAQRTSTIEAARHAEASASILELWGFPDEATAIRQAAPVPPADLRPPISWSAAATPAALPYPAMPTALASNELTRPTFGLTTLMSPQEQVGQMLSDIPPGERRARQLAVRAACLLVQEVITLPQAAKVLGVNITKAKSMPRDKLAADLVLVYGFGWAAGTINGGRLIWHRLTQYAQQIHAWAPPQRIDGYAVRQFLDLVGVAAMAKYRDRVARGATKPHPGDAAGSTAKGMAVANLKWLVARCHAPIDMASVSVQSTCKRARRYTAKAQPSFSLRMVATLSWHSELGETEYVRGVAGGLESLPMIAQRFVNAQRSSLLSISQGVVRGSNGFDGKIGGASQVGKPFWTSERDVRGSRAWLDAIIVMLRGVEDQHFLLRATNSPDGNPFRATAWTDGPETRARATVALRALLAAGPYAIPKEIALTALLHGGKRFLVNAGRAALMSVAERGEVGAWAGSRAQNARVDTPRDKSAETVSADMPDLYSAEAADEVVPEIMERLIGYCRTLVHDLGVASLPPVGGWTLFTRFRVATSGPQPTAPPSA